MKKYFNKALMYQWFYSTKGIIFIGCIIWGYIANRLINYTIRDVTNSIANNFDNSFNSILLPRYLYLGLIFMAIYYFGIGISKKNNHMFLYSGPFTKKEIRINILICMLINLIIFIIIYLYIMIMAYIRNKELMSIINGYWSIMGIELLKVFLIGICGILLFMILDMLFSNTIISAISMISVFPIGFTLMFVKAHQIYRYLPIGKHINKYGDVVWNMNYDMIRHPLFEYVGIMDIKVNYLLCDIFTTIIAIAVIFALFIIMENRNKIENNIGIFASKKAGNFVIIIASIMIGIIVEMLLTQKFVEDRIWNVNNNGILHGRELFLICGGEIVLVILFTFIIFVICKKILRKIS